MAKLFRLAKGPKPAGTCPAVKCDKPGFDDPNPENNPYKLCLGHHSQWHECGRPALDQPQPEQPAGDLPPRRSRKTKTVPEAASAEIVQVLEVQREEAKTAFLTIRQNVQITSQDHMNAAGELLRQIKEKRTGLKQWMDTYIGPLEESLKQLKRFFKAPIEYWDSAEKDVKEKIKAYELAARAGQDQALAAVEQAGMNAQLAAETTVAIAHGAQTLALPEGVQARERWRFEITDAAAVDRGLCCPDLELIGKLVAQIPDADKIRIMRELEGVICPGIKLVRDVTIVNGT